MLSSIQISNDRRYNQRISFDGNVTYSPMPYTELWKQYQSPQKSSIINISASGLLFKSNHDFPEDSLIKVKLHIPEWQKYWHTHFATLSDTDRNLPITAIAKIIRKQCQYPDHYNIAASFVSIDEGHQLAIKQWITSEILQ